MGLIIQTIEPNGRVHQDGRLKPGDRIIEINERSLIGVEFKQAQEILREALRYAITQSGQLELKILRNMDIYNNFIYSNNNNEEDEDVINERGVETNHYDFIIEKLWF